MDRRTIKVCKEPSRDECLSAIKMTLIRFNAFVQEMDRQRYYSPGKFTAGHRDFLYEMADRQYLRNMNAVLTGGQLEELDDEALETVLEKCRRLSDGFGLCVDIPEGARIADGEECHERETYRKAKDKKGFWETVWGALQGEFNEDQTGSEILIDMGLNFIPFVGQACDARDIAACLKKLVLDKRADEAAIWVTLLLTAIGCVPYAGDVVKAGCKAILKGADDIFLTVLKKIDAEDAYGAFVKFRSKFASGTDKAIETVCKWIKEARKSKYGSKIDSIAARAGESLRKAVELMKERIDEFGERIFKKERKEIIIETSGTKGSWNKNLNKKLEPNKIYKVDGYSYFTDKSGRVNKVSGELKLETKDRNLYQQGKSVEIKDGIAGEDQGGHIIARIFNGPGEQINYVPQSAKLNNGEWRAMERTWQNALIEGKRVDVEIEIVYDKNSKRPKRFDAKSTVIDKDGNKQIKEFKFYNS